MGQMAVPIVMALASAGIQYENTRRTANKQDAQLAQGLVRQGQKQRQADARVDEEVRKLETSTAADERAQRLNEYMQTIQRSKDKLETGLTPNIGSAAFQQDAAQGAADVQAYAGKNAALLSRIDAPTLQRQGEGFGYGKLATDIGLLGRESDGMRFIDELRLRAIRRNPYLDMAAAAAGSAASGYGGGNASSGGSNLPGADQRMR